MADDGRRELWATLEPSTFRGVPWFIESISVGGGRKATPKPILNSSEQVVDDVGRKQRTYQVRGYITAQYKKANSSAADTLADIEAETQARAERERRTGVTEDGPINLGSNVGSISQDYREIRQLITSALEATGSGSLVHPIEGEITNLVCVDFSIDESMKEVGIGRISATFVRETTTPIPEPVTGAKESVLGQADALDAAADAEITGNWAVSTSFVQGVENAGAKLTAAYEKALDVVKTVETVTEVFDQFQRDIAELQADVFEVVGDAVAVADSIKGVFASINSIFPLPSAAFQALQNGFDFGDTDVSFDFTTPSGKQKKANFDAANASQQCRYLSQAYRTALDLTYVTTDDVSTVEQILEAQHDKIVDGDAASDELKDALTALRESFFDFLADARLNARALVTEDVTTTTPRVLAYLLYDSDEDADTISGLNNVRSYETISGAVTVLSR